MNQNSNFVNVKKFDCHDCSNNVFCIKWKEDFNHPIYGSQYKCDNCWINLEKFSSHQKKNEEQFSKIKKFKCQDCYRNVDCLKWKTISNNINCGSSYKCDDCWNRFDSMLDKFCMDRLNIELPIKVA